MIRKFENFNDLDPWGEEDWEEHGDINNLIYRNNGPDFNCGDRVKCVNLFNRIADQEGTVIDYNEELKQYFVCFDNVVNNNRGQYFVTHYNMPYGHGFWMNKYNLRKI